MCEICQLHFQFDHESTPEEGPPCPKCGRFYIQPQNESCYHCYAVENLNETCEICAEKGAVRAVALN